MFACEAELGAAGRMDSLEDFGASVGTYSSLFNVYHDIIHPKKTQKEFRVNVQVPVNKNFGLTHACVSSGN